MQPDRLNIAADAIHTVKKIGLNSKLKPSQHVKFSLITVQDIAFEGKSQRRVLEWLFNF